MKMRLKIALIAIPVAYFLVAITALQEVGATAAGGVPTSQNGDPVADASVAPVYSSFTAITAAMNPCDGAGRVYAVHLATGAAASFVVLRDSATANTTSAVGTNATFDSTTQMTHRQFAPPWPFVNGLSINASACSGGNGTVPLCYTVLYDCVNEPN